MTKAVMKRMNMPNNTADYNDDDDDNILLIINIIWPW